MTSTAAAAFCAGFVIQSAILVRVRSWTDLLKILGCMGGALLALAKFSSKEDHLTVGGVIFALLLGYAIFYVLMFLKRIIRPTGPELLLFWNVLCLYLLYRGHHEFLTGCAVLLLAINLVSYASDKIDKQRPVRAYFYVCYLLLVSGTIYLGSTLIQHAFDQLGDNPVSTPLSLVTAFIAGTAITNVVINLAVIYMLVPNRGNSISDVKEHARLLADQYNFKRQPYPALMTLVITTVLLMLGNVAFNFIGDGLLITLAVLFLPIFSKLYATR